MLAIVEQGNMPISSRTWDGLVAANHRAHSSGWAEKGVFGTGIGPDYKPGGILWVGKSAGPLGSAVGSTHSQAESVAASTRWMVQRETDGPPSGKWPNCLIQRDGRWLGRTFPRWTGLAVASRRKQESGRQSRRSAKRPLLRRSKASGLASLCLPHHRFTPATWLLSFASFNSRVITSNSMMAIPASTRMADPTSFRRNTLRGGLQTLGTGWSTW